MSDDNQPVSPRVENLPPVVQEKREPYSISAMREIGFLLSDLAELLANIRNMHNADGVQIWIKVQVKEVLENLNKLPPEFSHIKDDALKILIDMGIDPEAYKER